MGDDVPSVAARRALLHLGNLLLHLEPPPAPTPSEPTAPVGSVCYDCACVTTPPADQCPRCGSASRLLLPGAPMQLLSAGRVLHTRLQRYPGLPTTQSLPPPLNLLTLLTLRQWLQHVQRHRGRWSAHLIPSVPLLSGDFVLCLANETPLDALASCPPGLIWEYKPEKEHHILHPSVPQRQAPEPTCWIVAPRCPQCGRPQALTAYLLPPAGSPTASLPSACCWFTPSSVPLTSAAAARSFVDLAGTSLAGVLPISILRRPSCSTPPVPPPTPWSRTLPPPPEASGGTALDDQPAPEPLRFLSVNCGGVGGKLANLLALLSYADADVICLQEAASLPPDAFKGTPYRA